jgi:voltage-gated potassium channel
MRQNWQDQLHEIIFEADTKSGKAFDVALIAASMLSVVAVMLESVGSIRQDYGRLLYAIEWGFTILFSIEYVLRLMCVRVPFRYARSFYGVIDLLAILPTYISIFVPGTQYLLVIRLLRILRVFRVLKLVHYVSEGNLLLLALRASRRKILVFLLAVMTLVVILGSLMYFIEGEENGFTSIPKAIYWAVVTLTTVGYGDILPQTPVGQVLASFIMIIGYGIIAVPTGIVTAELTRVNPKLVSSQHCSSCSREGHASDATYCKYCGESL